MGSAARKLAKMRGVQTYSMPGLNTRSNQHAMIEVIRELRHATDWDKDEKSGEWKPKTLETRNAGVSLSIVPILNGDDMIDMELTAEVVELLGFIDVDAGGRAVPLKTGASNSFVDRLVTLPESEIRPRHGFEPLFSTRKLTTSMKAKSGVTVAMELSSVEAGAAPKFKGATGNARIYFCVTAKIVN